MMDARDLRHLPGFRKSVVIAIHCETTDRVTTKGDSMECDCGGGCEVATFEKVTPVMGGEYYFSEDRNFFVSRHAHDDSLMELHDVYDEEWVACALVPLNTDWVEEN